MPGNVLQNGSEILHNRWRFLHNRSGAGRRGPAGRGVRRE